MIQGVLGGHFIPPNDIARELSSLHAPLGVYGVLGNHDIWLDQDEVKQAFAEYKIPLIDNKSLVIPKDNCEFQLIGIGDDTTGNSDIQSAMLGINPQLPSIVLTHSPDVFPNLPDTIALTIVGHTHGGQVRIPLIGSPMVPSKYGDRYVVGLITEGNKQLFVSPGIGTSMLPVRFLVPPEITILLLN